MSREDLRAGYLRVLNELYDPDAYFDRTEALFLNPIFEIGVKKKRKWYVRDLSARRSASFQGNRPVSPADDSGPRRRPAPRLPQAALAVLEGPPPARASSCSTCST